MNFFPTFIDTARTVVCERMQEEVVSKFLICLNLSFAKLIRAYITPHCLPSDKSIGKDFASPD